MHNRGSLRAGEMRLTSPERETAEGQEALDRFTGQMLQGAQNVRRWLWTVVLVALALLVVGFFTWSP
jgi:hypothetical protein